MEIELYDLETDIQEQNNLATDYPDLVAQMERIIRESHKPAAIEKFNFSFE